MILDLSIIPDALSIEPSDRPWEKARRANELPSSSSRPPAKSGGARLAEARWAVGPPMRSPSRVESEIEQEWPEQVDCEISSLWDPFESPDLTEEFGFEEAVSPLWRRFQRPDSDSCPARYRVKAR